MVSSSPPLGQILHREERGENRDGTCNVSFGLKSDEEAAHEKKTRRAHSLGSVVTTSAEFLK
ncbi:hypothetical protein MUK42_37416 [Musa troglodytarum]|uniref:Uncharacterized protein n=1 Tax=Musa troglodytarum TaxID=320322 RepID=A0A9E7GCU1_9LILI|nr:hypothetical protein MUK42_37416 [Musa troglodytarum]